MDKLKIEYDSVLWDGDQIGFLEDSKTIQLCVTNEDFENGEIEAVKAIDILNNLGNIKNQLINQGYTLI